MADGNLEEQMQQARTASGDQMQTFLYATREELLLALLENPEFAEKEALLLLNRKELPAVVIKKLFANRQLSSSHPVQLAIVRNPQAPAAVSLPLVKFLYPFELMAVCLLPAIPPEVKQAAESLLVGQLSKLALGQKINLAKRGPSGVVRHFLEGEESRIIQEVLNNPYLTENALLQALNRPSSSGLLLNLLSKHPKWSMRYSLRLAMVRHPHVSLATAARFIPDLKQGDLRDIAHDPRANPEIRRYLENRCKR